MAEAPQEHENSGVPLLSSEDALTGHAARVLTKLLYTAYVAVFTIVVVAAGGAAWVTRTDLRLEAVQTDVRELKEIFAADFSTRLRSLELTVAPGVLSQAKQDLEKQHQKDIELERRLERLEATR